MLFQTHITSHRSLAPSGSGKNSCVITSGLSFALSCVSFASHFFSCGLMTTLCSLPLSSPCPPGGQLIRWDFSVLLSAPLFKQPAHWGVRNALPGQVFFHQESASFEAEYVNPTATCSSPHRLLDEGYQPYIPAKAIQYLDLNLLSQSFAHPCLNPPVLHLISFPWL